MEESKKVEFARLHRAPWLREGVGPAKEAPIMTRDVFYETRPVTQHRSPWSRAENADRMVALPLAIPLSLPPNAVPVCSPMRTTCKAQVLLITVISLAR